MSGAALPLTSVSRMDLSGVNLRGADLQGADLILANLMGADLREADLRGADLSGANLQGANLGRATLREAFLIAGDLSGTNLREANFTDSVVAYTTFGNVDFSMTKGIETIKHFGPSTIGIDTLFRSHGGIPPEFLRGAGVPESLIEYMRALVGKDLVFFSCFISHASEDHMFVSRLYDNLGSAGVRCWYFPEDAKWGESVWGEIDRSIRLYDKLVVVCSIHSLQSGPVIREIERALQREDREKCNVLFPIRIDEYIFEEWEHLRKADVLAKVVGDFSDWKNPDSSDQALSRLLRNLEGEKGDQVAAH